MHRQPRAVCQSARLQPDAARKLPKVVRPPPCVSVDDRTELHPVTLDDRRRQANVFSSRHLEVGQPNQLPVEQRVKVRPELSARPDADRAVEAAEQIAKTMGEEEELCLGSARFDRAWQEGLVRLEAAGILIYSGDRFSLTFRHQTLFEFLRSRAFLRDHTSVADYVIREKQESLFVRPTLVEHFALSARCGSRDISPGVRPSMVALRTPPTPQTSARCLPWPAP